LSKEDDRGAENGVMTGMNRLMTVMKGVILEMNGGSRRCAAAAR